RGAAGRRGGVGGPNPLPRLGGLRRAAAAADLDPAHPGRADEPRRRGPVAGGASLRAAGARDVKGRWRALAPVAALLLLGAGVRALRFWGHFRYLYYWDETSIAIPALQILEGDVPVHFLGAEYMGNAPSYPLAAWFALAGSSPLALDIFAYGTGLAMLGSGWLLARRLYPGWAGLWALAVLAVPPVFL